MHIDTWKISGTRFHFGIQGFGQEETASTMPSDSLFAALVYRLVHQRGQAAIDGFIQPFMAGQPPFILTSTFPCAGDVRFFPAPANVVRMSTEQESDAVRPKDLKRARWVSETIFRRLLNGENLATLYPQTVKLQGKEALAATDELALLPGDLRTEGALLWKVDRRARVTLGRAVQNSNLFFTGEVTFAESCGLWFGIRWLVEDPASKRLLADLLTDLADAGLGAERSSGYGQCDIQPGQPLDLPEPSGDYWVALSRYLPRPEEIVGLQAEGASYTICKVGGWLDSMTRRGQRRRFVHLLQEGSVLGTVPALRDPNPVPGQVVDVRPRYPTDDDPLGHAVYRSGLAFAVGIRTGADGRSLDPAVTAKEADR